MTTTRSQLRTKVLEILNDTATSQVFQTVVLNSLIEEIELEVAQMWKWAFLRERQTIVAPVYQSLQTALTTGSTTIELGDVTNWGNTQGVLIMNDIVAYTGVDTGTDTLTGVTGISVAHEASEQCFPLLQLPTTYHKLIGVQYGNTSMIQMRDFMYTPETQWTKYALRHSPTCTVIPSGTTNYLLMFGHAEDDTIVVTYQRKPATYTTDSDVSSFPDEYIPYIARMVAGQAKLFYDDNLDGMGTTFYQMAQEKIMKMAKLYGEREQGMSRLITTSYQSGVTDRGWVGRSYID